jgi:hypothetical protein
LDVEVEVYRGGQGLARLDERWHALVEVMKHRSIVHAYEWHQSFLETQESDPESSLYVAVSVDGSVQAIMPLRPVPRSLVGFGHRPGLEVPLNAHVPFTDIVAGDPATLRAVASGVFERLAVEPEMKWAYVAFRRTLSGSCAARALADAPGLTARVSEAGSLDYLSLESYDELFGALSSRFRNNLRRARKRAEAMGDVTYHTGTSLSECQALFAEFLEVEASGWKGQEGTGSAIALDDGLRRFYMALMERFAVHGQCRIDVVRHGSRPIAAAFHLVMDHTLYGLKIGFDESYARIAPGNLLHWHIFRSACEDPQLKLFNMASDAAWHAQWRPRTAELFDIIIFRPGLTGRLASVEQRVVDDARVWRKRAARRWPVSGRSKRRFAWSPRRPA